MIKTVIYARYSAGPRQTDQSIEGQVRVCREYAEKKGLEIVRVYADAHISGRTDARPQFQQMMADARQGLFEALLVYKTDRLSRDRVDSSVYKKELRSMGIKIYYAAEPIPDGPEGVILEGLLESMAEFYSLELSQKIKRGIMESAYKRKSTGGTRLFGYTSDKDRNIIIKEDEAEAVRLLFQHILDGSTAAAEAAWLNSMGFKTTQGHAFSTQSVIKMLTNRKYIGEYRYLDIVVPGAMPAIVDEEVFMACQGRYNRKVKKIPKGEYLLSQKLICGLCGSFLQGVSGTGRDGQPRFYYACGNRRKGTCTLKNMRADEVEQQIFEFTEKYVLQPDVLKDLTEKVYQA